MSDEQDKIEEYSKQETPPVMILNAGALGAPAKPVTLKALAWKILWAFVGFVVIVILASLLITWLWNENLAGVTGLSEIDLRTAASGVVLFRLASFLWRM